MPNTDHISTAPCGCQHWTTSGVFTRRCEEHDPSTDDAEEAREWWEGLSRREALAMRRARYQDVD
jgi:hypothetical protein